MGAERNDEGGRRSAAGRVAVGHPVDVASGTLFHDFEDRALPGRMPLVFGRRYSSALSNRAAEAPAGMFGPGWASPFEMRILRDLEGYRMVTEDGEGEVAFDDFAGLVDAGETVRTPGAFHELRREGDRLVATRWDPDTGEVVRFFFAVGHEGVWWPLVSRQYVDGHGVDVERDRGGRITALRQRRERRGFRLAYDGAGRVAEVYLIAPTAAWEGAWGNGREGYAPQDLQRLRGELPLLRYRYDERGLLAQLTDALGQSAHYEYDAAGRMTREVTLGGMVYLFGYDADGRCVLTTGEGDYGRNELEIDTLARETRVTDSRGHTTTYRWNDDGQVEAETSPLGHTATTVYDELGRVVQRVSPGGAVTSFEYDERGDRVRTTEPDGAVTAYAFDDRHQAIHVTDPLHHETHRSLDEAGRIVAVTNALGHAYTYAYSPVGDLVAITSPKGDTRRLEWNGSGDLVGQTDYLGHRTAYEFNPEGWLTAVTDAAGYRTEAVLDAGSRVREVRFPDSARRRYAWNAYNQLTSFTDERGVVTEIRYAPPGLVTEFVRPHGGRVRFEWGTVPGQLLAILNERGERYAFEYDADDRATREVDFGGRAMRYDLGPDGWVERVENNAGHVSTIGRDAAGRVTEVLHDDGTQTSYEYDLRSFITRADNGQCVVERRYDALGRMVLEVQDGHEVASAYDEANNRIERRSSLGSEVRFEWDPNGQLSRLLPRDHRALSFTYDARLNEVRRGVDGGVQIEHVYDSRRRVVEQSVFGPPGSGHAAAGAEPIVQRAFRYDAASNLAQLIDARWGATQYAYDQLGRIVSAQVARGLNEHFAYDATDNLVEIGRAPTLEQAAAHAEELRYGAGNTLLRRGTVEYEHDALGQRIRKTGPEGTTRYRWNRSGQLAEVELPDGAVWRFRYDAFGRRVEKQGPSGTTSFVWDGNVVLHEVEVEGDASHPTEWEFAPNGFEPLYEVYRGDVLISVNDINGRPQYVLDEEGREIESLGASSYGAVEDDGGARRVFPIGLQGQYYDYEVNLYYNRYRYYDGEVGRYISVDPVGIDGGINQYAYPPEPNTWIDPYGLTGGCNGEVTYYHATSEEYANSIRQNGIDLSVQRPTTDFGQGFYVTTDRAQAQQWASRRFGNQGVVLEFRVNPSDLQGFNTRSFTGATSQWRDFVIHNRTGGALHSHDIVQGPMLLNPGAAVRGAPARSGGQQTSFHSQQAADTLYRGLQP